MNLYERYHKDRKTQIRVMDRWDFTYRTLLNFIDKYTKNRNTFLDIGCGVGKIDFYLANKGKKVLGIDISKNGIKMAKSNAYNLGITKNVKFRVINFPKLLPAGKFDVVVCSEVLEHIPDDKLAVKKIASILEDDGLVIASSPSKNAPLYKMGSLQNFDKEVGHLRRYTEKSYRDLFEAAGLSVLETKRTEGVFRNFLFTNYFGGLLLKVLNKWPFSEIVTMIDNISVSIFGESDIFLVATKK